MSEQKAANMYGIGNDEVKFTGFNFGLTAGQTFLTKFEWIPNGGKDNAEAEALEIVFNIAGSDKGYRKFPVTKGFLKNGGEITDPNAPEFVDAVQTLNAVITHILKCFVNEDTLRTAFNRPIPDFKTFCQVCASVLPKDFASKPLDIFMQYQWKISPGQSRTYLEIPNSVKSGRFLCAAITPQPDAQGNNAEWKEVRKNKEEVADNDQNALFYQDGAGNIHPFKRYGRYLKSNSANQQLSELAREQEAAAANISQQSSANPGNATQGSAETW